MSSTGCRVCGGTGWAPRLGSDPSVKVPCTQIGCAAYFNSQNETQQVLTAVLAEDALCTSVTEDVPAWRTELKGTFKVEGVKHDMGKLPLELLPTEVLAEVTKVLQFGANKYAANNWRGGIKYSRVFGATLRHMYAWWQGEDNDSETNLSHLAHAICELMFALSYVLKKKTQLDDRSEHNV